jgi:hypothetical protein
MNLAAFEYHGNLMILLSCASSAAMTLLTISCGCNGGARKSNSREDGRIVCEKRLVSVNEGRTRVVRTPRALYLPSAQLREHWAYRLSSSARRVWCRLTSAALLAQ